VILAGSLPVLGALTDDERRVAIANARENIARVVSIEDSAAEEVLRALEDSRVRLLSRIRTGTEFDAAIANDLLRDVDEQMKQLAARLGPTLRDRFRDVLAAGDRDMMGYALKSLPPHEHGPGFSSIDPVLLDFATRNSADLVGQFTTKLRADLNLTITAAATGTSTAADVAEKIGSTLREADRDPGIYGTLATQIERVTRTELGRLYSGSGEARLERLKNDTGRDVRKRWVATNDARTRPTHWHLSGATIPVDERFNVAVDENAAESVWWTLSYEEAERKGGALGWPASGPHDSALPGNESINCRCVLIPVFGPLKRAIAAVFAARAADASRRGLRLRAAA
jgi:hypothetical protein